MPSQWPDVYYERWRETCDTLHAHVQVLGKLAVVLAPPEPQLQHAALRLTARGWETNPLPAPNGSGAFVAGPGPPSPEAVAGDNGGARGGGAPPPPPPPGGGARGPPAGAGPGAGGAAL